MPTIGGRDPPLAGPIPESGNTAGWVDVHLKVQSWQKLAGIHDMGWAGMGIFTVCQQECVSSALTDFPSLAPQVSRNLRALFAGHSTSLIESCAMGADREVLLLLLLLLLLWLLLFDF